MLGAPPSRAARRFSVGCLRELTLDLLDALPHSHDETVIVSVIIGEEAPNGIDELANVIEKRRG
jgi:hypothetical protein